MARSLKIPWVIRVEDIDKPRVLTGAQEQQLRDLETLGLRADNLFVQSHFHERHWQVFAAAVRSGQVYPCDCSRKEVQSALAGLASAPHEAPAVYSGRCRIRGSRALTPTESLAWRFRMAEAEGHDDFIVARSSQRLNSNGLPDSTDFTPAYHWACAIDDYDGRHAWLVRSIDLKPAARLQHAIQAWLSNTDKLERPFLSNVFHTSLVTQNDGHRLEKRTRGVTLPELDASGITAVELIERFKMSFNRDLFEQAGTVTAAEGRLLEESASHLSLADLKL